ncbi:MAG: coproporphyrinogen dehydrogenase HemZ [Clostridia bacterium]|nr:coproporphyrinogen dehydrogenase HemZ [Clostridia bacterium]
MKLFRIGHDFVYETGNLCFLFFPGERVEQASQADVKSGDFIVTRLKKSRASALALCMVCHGGRHGRAHERVEVTTEGFDKECELALGRAFYRAAAEVCGFFPPWGTLTGIRPVKLLRAMRAQGMSDGEAAQRLAGRYYVTDEKATLLAETADAQSGAIALSRPESFSLYVSIPFCTSRCAYCSFVSHDIEKAAKLVPEYVRLLCEELAATARTAAQLGLRLETVYFGGGTPTSLSAGDLRRIMAAVSDNFDLSSLREYTVEAGRPDTLTAEKLEAIVEGGAGRISINPQTMDDAILRAVGRLHTAGDIRSAYGLARQAGVPAVNMDLIAGLPGDTPAGFENTLRQVIALQPEAVTVHTLAMKRSSELVTGGGAIYNAQGSAVNAMLLASGRLLYEARYRPYYLYRQKNSAGNLENTGWSLAGFEGLYNIYIMDETHTILSCGAGGVSKLRQPGGGRIERIFNFKYPYEYISRFEQILDKKKQVTELYAEFAGQNADTAFGSQPRRRS